MPGAVTSGNLPKPPVVPNAPAQTAAPKASAPMIDPDFGDLSQGSTFVAKPLADPDFMHVVPVNPLIELRWVNYDVGERHSSMRYDQMKAAGFVNARPTDIKSCPPSLIRDGKVIRGDVICMKIAKKDYQGALLWNQQRAEIRQTRAEGAKRGKKTVRDAIAEAGAPPDLARKISAFAPSEAELNGLTGSDGSDNE